MSFSLGDVVELTPSAKVANVEPGKYERGVVVDPSGVWNIYGVKWNGIDHPIGMRADEICLKKEGNSNGHE